MDTQEFIEELQAFDPNYQTKYRSLRDAALAANLEMEFYDWLLTPDGIRYQKARAAHDHTADNEVRKQQVLAEREMFTRNRANEARGYVSAGDEV